MNQTVLTLVPGGQPLGASLGYEAASVVIDNYTSSYVSLGDAGKVIPPWTYGAVVALPPGIWRADATLTPTVPAVPGPPVPTVQASLTWTDQPLPASPGHLLQQSQFSTRQKLYPDGVAVPVNPATPSFTVTAGGTANPRFTLPAGTAAVRVLATALGLVFTYQLLVEGHQTTEQYWGSPSAPGSPQTVPSPTLPFTIPVEIDWDTQLDFSVVGDASHPTSYFVSALLAPEAPGQAGASQSVNVINATPLPWDGVADSGDPGVGVVASSTLAGVAGHRWICQAVRAELAASGAAPAATVARVHLRDGASGSGAILWSWTLAIPSTAGLTSPLMQLSGLSIAGTPGNAMTLEFSVLIANAFQTCGFGARLL